jgi:hypothetical protein
MEIPLSLRWVLIKGMGIISALYDKRKELPLGCVGDGMGQVASFGGLLKHPSVNESSIIISTSSPSLCTCFYPKRLLTSSLLGGNCFFTVCSLGFCHCSDNVLILFAFLNFYFTI